MRILDDELLDQADAALIAIDLTGSIVYWNAAASSLYGWSSEEALGRNVVERLVSAEDRAAAEEVLVRVVRGERWAGALRVRRKDGSLFEAEIRNAPLRDESGKLVGSVGVSLDSSERRRMEDHLRRTSEELSALLAASPLAIINLDADENVTTWSGAAEALFGWSEEEVLGRPLPTIPNGEESKWRELRRRQRAGETIRGLEVSRVRKDGTRIDVEIHTASRFDEQGAFVGTVAYANDISERRQMDARLRANVTLLRAIADGMADVLIVKDVDGRCIFANGAAARALGLGDAEALIGKDDRELHAPAEAERVISVDREVMATGIPWVLEETVELPSGPRVYLSSKSPLQDEDGRTIGIIVVATDVTDRKRIENKLRASYDEAQRARRRAERLTKQLTEVQELTDAALAGLSLSDLLDELLSRLRRLVGADTAVVLLREDETDDLRVRASLGVPEASAQHVRVPIGQGFAGRIAATGEPMILEDATSFSFVSQYPAELGLKSIAGVPLVVEDRVLGVVHVGSRRRRKFRADDLRLLRLVADRTALVIENARHHERERRIAETLQRSLLTRRLPQLAGLRLSAVYLPGAAGLHVGGDWYDALELPGGRLALVIGDVVGHGVESAAVMGQMRNALRAYLLVENDPGAALTALDNLVERTGEGDMTTVAVVVVDPRSGSGRYASAGHPPLLMVYADGRAEYLESPGSVPLGVRTHERYTSAEIALEPGASLVAFTDGLVERRRSALQDALERLRSLASEAVVSGPAGASLARQLVDGMDSDSKREDDVAIISVRFEELAGRKLELDLPAEPEAIPPLKEALGSFLDAAGADSEEAHGIVAAGGEAAANAVEHASGPVARRFAVSIDTDGDDARVVVSDSGDGRREPRTPDAT